MGALRETNRVEQLIGRARRRQLGNLLFQQLSEAVCAGLAGMVLLLLVGTQILAWPWITTLTAGAALVGFRSLRRGWPDLYGVAQGIDRRLDLQDALSTAYYLLQDSGTRRVSEPARAIQLAQAERVAAGVSLEHAIPFAAPRSLYALAVLGLVASSLLALRYGITGSLDFRPPLTSLLLARMGTDPQLASHPRPQPAELNTAENREGGFSENAHRQDRQSAEPGASPESQEAQSSKGDAARAENERAGSREGRSGSSESNRGEESATGQASVERRAESAANVSQAAQSQASGRSGASQRAANSQHEGNGLVDRVRSAVERLISRLKSQPDSSQPRESASRQGSARQDPRQGSQARRQNGHAGQSGDTGENPGDPQGPGDQQAQSGPGKQGGPESDQADKQGQSGIGRQDGNKDVKQAEQLAAMGKISEILGRRSQDVSGEAMVEVDSGKQRLETPYVTQKAGHRDAGTEIGRDQIPLAYQAFVQRYFEEVRKAQRQKKVDGR